MKKIICLIFVLLLTLPLLAGELKGVKMAESIEVEGKTLVLNGMGLRKKVIFKVYVAGLYLESKESDADKILKEDKTRHIILHFLRSVKGKSMSEAMFKGLEDNTPGFSPELKQKFESYATMMDKVTKGDKMVFTYIPGTGTKVYVREELKGTIEGKDFGDALFACWIGPKPGPGKKFKNNILGIN